MPDAALLTPLGRRMIRRWPPFLQDVPEFVAIAHACAKAIEDADDLLAQLRMQYSPRSADIMLREWEATLGAPVDPAGQDLEQRRATVLAYLRRLRGTPYGLTWKQKVEMLVGPVFTVEEHHPDIPGSPAANVIRVTIPFAPDTARYIHLQTVLRDITPAHLEIQLVYDADGFLLDLSLLDLGAL